MEKLNIPVREDDAKSIRIFPAAEPDPRELVLQIDPQDECCICHKKQENQDKPFVILATVDGSAQQIYCGLKCTLAHLDRAIGENAYNY